MQATIDYLAPLAPTPVARAAFRVALVGIEFEENLSLRYLAGALQAVGYGQVQIYPYNSLSEAEALAAELVAAGVGLVGVSMAFQVRAVEDMALVELLRRAGYRGHVAAGGQFATLHYPELFEDCPGLSSVVRFEAEATIVQLADALCPAAGPAPDLAPDHSPDLSTVSGLVWRGADGALRTNPSTPVPDDLNQLPWPLRRPDRAEYLGLKTMHMVGSRGCHATCKYCCVAALAAERSQAAKAAGAPSALPGTRRRSAAGVAAEIAALYFGQGVRIFEFQDDNWIHPRVDTAVAYFRELKAELDRRGVGQIGLSLKTRADSVQPDILRALQAIGLIRVFVGIESGTQSLLTRLGRKSRDNASLRALQTLREFGVPAYFNALLFGPDIRFADLEPELEFLDECLDFPFEVVEVVIYGKTGLYQSLTAENRLHGNYLAYEYDYLDEATQRTHALVSQLDTRHFGVYSPVKMAADLGFNLGILRVFYPGPATARLAADVADLTRAINQDQLRLIRRAAAYARQPGPLAAARRALRHAAVTADLEFYRRIIELHQRMEQLVAGRTQRPEVRCYYRTGAVVQSALLAGLFALLAGPAAAQSPRSRPAPGTDSLLTVRAAALAENFSRRDWQRLAQELRPKERPLRTYLDGYYVLERSQETARQPLRVRQKSYHQYEKALARLERQRTQQDYQQLRRLLLDHQPKIRVASSLAFLVDATGRVQRVRETAQHRPALTPAAEAAIVRLLRDRQFRTHERWDQWFTNPSRERLAAFRQRTKRKLNTTLIKLHLKKAPRRRGPMD